MKLTDESKEETTSTEGPNSSNGGTFDFERLRLPQNFAESVGVKKEILTVPVRKPSRHEFVRTRPGEAHRFPTAVLEVKEERETYLVDPAVRPEIAGEIKLVVLVLTANRQGTVFFWPINLPGDRGRTEEWSRSALAAASRAETVWVRVASNMTLGAYEMFCANSDLPEPEWPEMTTEALLRIAFKDRIINGKDHPVLRRLRGEV